MKALPADAQEGAIHALATILNEKFGAVTPKVLFVAVMSGSDSRGADITLPFDGVSEEKIRTAITSFKALPKEKRDVIGETIAKAKNNQDSKYAELIRKAIGAQGNSMGIMTSPTARTVVTTLDLLEGQDEQGVVAKLSPIFKNQFGAELLKVAEKEYIVSGVPTKKKVVQVDMEAIATYDKEKGAGAFERDLKAIQPQIDTTLNLTPERKPETTPPAKPKELMDHLSDNKGMGIGGIIGAIVGWLIGKATGLGETIGALIGGLLGGGAGAMADGKDGVLGIGGSNQPSMTPALQKSVTAYANARFADPTTGVADPNKVNQFVSRYASMVAKNMKPEEQNKRAGEVSAMITEMAKEETAKNMQSAMAKAMAVMKDPILIPTDSLPPINVNAIKSAAQNLR